MASAVMDQGIAAMLSDIRAAPDFAGLKLRLYQNPHIPSTADNLAAYVEASFPGYAPVTLGGWSAVAVAGHVASTTAATATFTLTGGTQQIYGAYITDAGGTVLWAAASDPNAPITLSTTVNAYQVTVTFTLQSA